MTQPFDYVQAFIDDCRDKGRPLSRPHACRICARIPPDHAFWCDLFNEPVKPTP